MDQKVIFAALAGGFEYTFRNIGGIDLGIGLLEESWKLSLEARMLTAVSSEELTNFFQNDGFFS